MWIGAAPSRASRAVVVSAMAGETDRLVNFCREANALYDPAEYDVVVASGEQVTSGLLALTLQSLGCQARSWLGWQMPFVLGASVGAPVFALYTWYRLHHLRRDGTDWNR